jgi:uncharacterized protein (DUF433 family)
MNDAPPITAEMLQRLPLTLRDDGTIRVTGTRVLLELIVQQFKWGASPEHIRESFPTLTLRDVYGALYFYLDQTAAVEAYLQQQAQDAEAIRRMIEASPFYGNKPGLRERLLARRDRL